MTKTMADIITAHLDMTGDEYDLRYIPAIRLLANDVERELSAAGFGLVADAGAKAHQLKSVRGQLKTLGKNLDSWESEGHTTATIRFLRQWIGRADAAVRGEG